MNMAKKAARKSTAKAAKVDEKAVASMERAKRWAQRGDASMAVAEFIKFDRSADDYHTICALHPYMQELLSKARK